MSLDRLSDFSNDFVLSSGTVSVDLSREVILVLYDRSTQEFLLPKGRKHVGETLEAAAIRETMEESGYRCRLLEHGLMTQAPSLTTYPWTTEPIAVHQRVLRGVRKIIFWYLAQVDSTSPQVFDSQEDGGDFEVHWMSGDVAAAKMTHKEDGELIHRALRAVAEGLAPLSDNPFIPQLA